MESSDTTTLRPRRYYRFGPFKLDIDHKMLFCDERQIHLTPRAFGVLLMLVKNQGQIISNDGILNETWSDAIVQDQNVTYHINRLRQALKIGDPKTTFIKNYPKRGYAFIADAVFIDETGNGNSGSQFSIQPDLISHTNGHASHAVDLPAVEPQADDIAVDTVSLAYRRGRYFTLILGAVIFVVLLVTVAGMAEQFAVIQIALFDLIIASASSVAYWLYFDYARKNARSNPDLPGDAPFRGLRPFRETDTDNFYGRENEVLALASQVTVDDSRLTILFGESGCGKTSLIRAGLISALKEKNYAPIYCRAYSDTLKSIAESCRNHFDIAPTEKESEVDFLRRATEDRSQNVLIIFDQFEEFFINNRSSLKRRPLIEFIAECLQDDRLRVGFLFSIREDFLYLIQTELSPFIEAPLSEATIFELQNLHVDCTEEIIEKSFSSAGIRTDAGFARFIAADLARDSAVLASEIQIIGEQLYRKRITSARDYERHGGKETLTYDYLEETVQRSPHPEITALILSSLVSEDNTKKKLTVDEITSYVRQAAERSNQPKSLSKHLEFLVQNGLIREISDEDAPYYELMHDYLATKVNQMIARIGDRTRKANLMLRQHRAAFVVDKTSRVPLRKLRFIQRFSTDKRGKIEQEMFTKSLRWGLFTSIGKALLFSSLVVLIAAAFSQGEVWDDLKASDGHTAAVRRAVFSPDGRLLVSVGEDSKIIVWDFQKRIPVTTLTGHKGFITAAEFSPDGKHFATGSTDKTVIVWNASSFQKEVTLDCGEPVNAVGFSKDNSTFAASSFPPSTRVWDTRTWKEIRYLAIGTGYGNLYVNDDGSKLLLSTAPLTANTWNIHTGEPLPSMFPNGQGGNWTAISESANQILAASSNGNAIFSSLSPVTLLATLPAHHDHCRAAAFSPDGRLAATGAENIILWDTKTHTKLSTFEYPSIVWSVEFSPDGRWLVSGHGDGSIIVWDVVEKRRVADLNEHTYPVRSVSYSNDGKLIASGGEDSSIIIWNADTLKKAAVLQGNGERINALAISPDSKWLASGTQFGGVAVWDLTEMRLRETLNTATSYGIAISPDGRKVATSGNIYNTADGTVDQGFDATKFCTKYPGGTYGLAFSPDGKYLARGTDLHNVFLLSADDWRMMQSADASESVTTISYSPDSKWIVSGQDDGTVSLWQAEPLKEVAVLGRHRARVKSVAFSPDGRSVASAGDDKVINLWDVSRRKLITTIGDHSSPVLSVAFSPDGRRLVSGDHDSSVHVYVRHATLFGRRLD